MLHPRHDPRAVACVWSDQLPAAEDLKVEGYSDRLPEHDGIVTISDLYVLMGRSIEAVNHVSAGNIVGIGGLEGVVLKSATLSTTISCPAFHQMSFAATPIVQVQLQCKQLPMHASITISNSCTYVFVLQGLTNSNMYSYYRFHF